MIVKVLNTMNLIKGINISWNFKFELWKYTSTYLFNYLSWKRENIKKVQGILHEYN